MEKQKRGESHKWKRMLILYFVIPLVIATSFVFWLSTQPDPGANFLFGFW